MSDTIAIRISRIIGGSADKIQDFVAKQINDLPESSTPAKLIAKDASGANVQVSYSALYNLIKSSLDQIYRNISDSYTKTEVDGLVSAGIRDIQPESADDGIAGIKFPTASGTYTNYGNTVVDISDGLNMIFSDGAGGFIKSVVPIELSGIINSIDDIEEFQFKALKYSLVDNVVENFSETLADWRRTGSTFSGWGTNIGKPQNFDSLIFKVRAPENPITQFRIRLFENTITGTEIFNKIIDVNIPVGEEYDLQVFFDMVIENGTAEDIIFVFQANQKCDLYGSSSIFVTLSRFWTSGDMSDNIGQESTGSDNAWVITGISGITLSSKSEDFLLQKSKKNTLSLFNQEEEFAHQNTYIKDFVKESSEPIFIESNSIWRNTGSTFSGWSCPIGMPQNFNAIRFRVRARDNAITQIRCVVRINALGTILQDKTITLNILPGESEYVTVLFNEIIENITGEKLFFAYYCNQKSDQWGISSTSTFPVAEGYDDTRYFTNGSLTGDGAGSSTRYVTWVEVGVFQSIIGLSEFGFKYLSEKLNLSNISFPIPEILLPSVLYATEGVELNIFWDNVIFSDLLIDELFINVTCNRGQQFERGWRYTPGSETGSESFTIAVYHKTTLLREKTITLQIENLSGGPVSKKLLCLGDSTTAGGQYISLITSEYGSNPTVEFLGTKGSGANKHEGVSGWSYASFVGSESPFYINGQLDFSAYLTNNGYTMSADDLITIHLGINDVFSDGSDSNITAIMGHIQTLVTMFRAAVPNINICLLATIPPSISQDAFGASYGNTYTLKGYLANYQAWMVRLLTEWDTSAKQADRIYVAQFNCNMDRVYNFPKTTVPANARTSETVTYYNNGVHPSVEGYNQMGDSLWMFIKNMS